MKLLPRVTASSEYEVYRLWRSPYGLKQSPLAWFEKIPTYSSSISIQNRNDPFMFLQWNSSMIIVLVKVDEIIIIGSDMDGIWHTQDKFHAHLI